MSQRRDVSPATLAVAVGDGVTVEYLDGREVTYPGPVEPVEGSVRCGPGKEVHVLVTDAGGDRGVMVYVNDRNTDGDANRDCDPDADRNASPRAVAVLRDGSRRDEPHRGRGVRRGW